MILKLTLAIVAIFFGGCETFKVEINASTLANNAKITVETR